MQLHGTIKDDIIIKAENLGITNFDIIERLKKYFNYTNMHIRNDAKCAALCEKEYGALKYYDDCIFFCLGTGIGSAVFINGKLLKAKKYAGYEIGHIVIQKNGKRCTCGNNGCFETYASMRALKEEIALAKNLKYITGTELFEILKNDFNGLENIIDEFIENLSIGLSNTINIFEPEAICIGGSFVYYENILLKLLKNKMNEKYRTLNGEIPEITIAKMGNDAGIIGATI